MARRENLCQMDGFVNAMSTQPCFKIPGRFNRDGDFENTECAIAEITLKTAQIVRLTKEIFRNISVELSLAPSTRGYFFRLSRRFTSG